MPEKLKKGWTRVAFGDVVSLCRERSSKPAEEGFDRYVGLEHLDPGDLKIRRWGNVTDGTTFTNVFRAGQVLFGKRRAYQRKVALADFDGVCSGDIYALEGRREFLLPELLPFICQTDRFLEHAVGTSAGSLSPRTNWVSLASFEFALPPLEEQRRIADLFHAMDARIDALADASQIATSVSEALCAYFIAGGSEPDIRFNHRSLPPTWQIMALGDIVDQNYGLVDGPFGSNLKSCHYRNCGYPVLQSAFIAKGHFDPDAGKWVYVDEGKFREQFRSAVRAGDIAMVKVGVNTGASALLPADFRTGILAGNCLKITPDQNVCLPRYLIRYLHWLRHVGHLERHVTSTQQRSLTLGRLREQAILIPPLDEQSHIASCLDSCDAAALALQSRSRNAREQAMLALKEIQES